MQTTSTNLTLLYAGDPYEYRRKVCGLNLIDQLFLSVETVRKNWSKQIEIIFVHTLELSPLLRHKMSDLNIQAIRASGPLEPRFLMANKILAGLYYEGNNDILFLDCDTVIHQRPIFNRSHDLFVAYDATRSVEEQAYIEFFTKLQIPMPTGSFPDSPAYEYYHHDREDLFPMINAGVFFLRRRRHKQFFATWQKIFTGAFELFLDRDWAFYIEQMAFLATACHLEIPIGFFEKGINFICTPRAPALRKWPKHQIIIEHYAGNTSRPLVFDGDMIDVNRSGLGKSTRIQR